MGFRERVLALGAAIVLLSLGAPWIRLSPFELAGPLETWAAISEGDALLGVRLLQAAIALGAVAPILGAYGAWSLYGRWPTLAVGGALAAILALLMALGFPGLAQSAGPWIAILGGALLAVGSAWPPGQASTATPQGS